MRVSVRVNNLIGHWVEIGGSHEACGLGSDEEGGWVGVLWDWLFPDIRNIVSVNTSRGTDRERSGCDR